MKNGNFNQGEGRTAPPPLSLEMNRSRVVGLSRRFASAARNVLLEIHVETRLGVI